MPVLLALQLAGDPAAAVFAGGELRCAVRDCVVTRRAPGDAFPSAAIDAVLAAAGRSEREVTRVVATGLAAPGPAARVRAMIAQLGGRRAEGEVRIRNRPPERGAVSRRALEAALVRARLGHAPIDRVEPESALRALQAVGAPGAGPALSPGGMAALAAPVLGDAALALGAAFAALPTLRLPADPFWAPGFTEQEAYRALSNAGLPRVKVEDPVAVARELLRAGERVAWAQGRAAFGALPLGPRLLLVPAATRLVAQPGFFGPDLGDAHAELLLAPDGLPALTPVDVVAAWRAQGGRLILGNWLV